MTTFLEILINGDDMDLNLHSNHTLVYCALPENFPELVFPNSPLKSITGKEYH